MVVCVCGCVCVVCAWGHFPVVVLLECRVCVWRDGKRRKTPSFHTLQSWGLFVGACFDNTVSGSYFAVSYFILSTFAGLLQSMSLSSTVQEAFTYS